jgi:hypothetical protein
MFFEQEYQKFQKNDKNFWKWSNHCKSFWKLMKVIKKWGHIQVFVNTNMSFKKLLKDFTISPLNDVIWG